MKEETKSHFRRAERFLEEAQYLASGGYWDAVVNRAYYSMFHAATAVLLEEGIERASHKGLIAAFGEHFTQKGRMDPKFHRYLIDGFEWRSESDYFPNAGETESEGSEANRRAKEFLVACQGFLQK